MAKQIHYSSAPITEAIIDLRVKPCSDVSIDVLAQLADNLRGEYPESGAVYEATGSLHVRPGLAAAASAQQTQTGIRCQTEDGKHICQLLQVGLAHSWLAPYDTWGAFRDRARAVWRKYRDAIEVESISRLAVRYINRVDIPQANVDLKEYFRTSPEISPDLPQTMAGFFMQVQLPLDGIQATAVINQTIASPPDPGTVPVILDIDIFRTTDVPQAEADIWTYFETLHDHKNEVFESCITEKARELFN